jgi:hypothetical protein
MITSTKIATFKTVMYQNDFIQKRWDLKIIKYNFRKIRYSSQKEILGPVAALFYFSYILTLTFFFHRKRSVIVYNNYNNHNDAVFYNFLC